MTARVELLDVLETLTEPTSVHAVPTVRRILAIEGTSVSKSELPVPTEELRGIYESRRLSPLVPPRLSLEFENLVRVGERFPTERWHIYSVVDGPAHHAVFAVFANEQGTGRVLVEFRDPDPG